MAHWTEYFPHTTLTLPLPTNFAHPRARLKHLDPHVKSKVTKRVSPAAFTNMLEPVRNTLRELSMLDGRHGVPYDGTTMDLSAITQLRDLEMTSCLLVTPGPPCEDRMSLEARLPVRL